MAVRAFYLDLAQWALDDPARWGQWAVPCPIRASDIQYKKQKSRTKARMDARTRERLPVMPALAAAVDRSTARTPSPAWSAARAAWPGELFTAGGQHLRRAGTHTPSPRDLGRGPRQRQAAATWAARRTTRSGPGPPSTSCATPAIRLEELIELSHHSLVQYRLPTSGELVPLLSVAPSKTDAERLLVIDPELADVLSAVITRARGADGAVPLVPAYDTNERTWNPPMPLLFQRRRRPGEPPRSPPTESATSSAARSPPPASPAPTASPSTSAPTTSAGSSPPTRSSTACPRISPRSSSATPTSTPRWATRPSTPRKPSTATAPTSPAAGSSAPVRSTGRRPTPSGRSSSATSSAAASPSATADAHTPPAASTSTPASLN